MPRRPAMTGPPLGCGDSQTRCLAPSVGQRSLSRSLLDKRFKEKEDPAPFALRDGLLTPAPEGWPREAGRMLGGMCHERQAPGSPRWVVRQSTVGYPGLAVLWAPGALADYPEQGWRLHARQACHERGPDHRAKPRGKCRIRQWWSLVALLLVAAGCARVQVLPSPVPTLAPAPIPAADPASFSGEKLEYEVSWWGVPVGEVILTSVSSGRFGSGKLLKLALHARPNPYLNTFYPVRVELVSLLDPESRLPRRFQALIKRRWRTHESTITFHPGRGTSFHELPKKRTAHVPLGPTTQDGLSVIHYARTLDVQVGKTIPIEITADGKNWHLTARILQIGNIRLKKVGEFPAFQGEAKLTYPVPFFQGAKARIWFSADGQRIPLLAKIHSRIGPVSVVLTKRSKI